jgi:hypothetical protein
MHHMQALAIVQNVHNLTLSQIYSCQIKEVIIVYTYPSESIVFKGPVYRTEKKTETGLNWTD